MSTETFQPHLNRFILLGLLLAAAGDTIGTGYYQFLKNVRSIQNGVIEPRKGMVAINASAVSSIHTIKRLNDDNSIATQAFQRFVGNGTALHSDNAAHNAFSSIATGFSGNPLSLIPFAPNEAAEPYLYVGDSSKMGKVKSGGTFLNMGVISPILAPTATLAQLQYNAYASLTTGAANSWTAGGTTSVTAVNQSRTNTTITRILYDVGSTGWASIQPASFQEINVGARVTLAASEQVLVEAVFEAAHTTTIAAIAYDSGSSGLCSIVLTAASKAGLRRDACLFINAAEMVRILDVIEGPNNSISIRCSSSGTFSAGQTVTGIATFRCFTSGTFSATNTITETVHRLSVTSGIGLYSNSAASLDMSFIAGRPMTPNDFIHISVKMDLPANLTEGKLMLDCDGATNDFTKNYFYFAFNANDFTPAVNDQITTLSAKQTKLQRRLIDLQNRQARQQKLDALQNQLANIAARIKSLQDIASTAPLGVGSETSARFETVAGASQWTDFWIRLDGDHLTRVGSDLSRGLADIKAIRLQFNVTATTVIDVADFYYGGGYGTEVTPVGTPYIYAYRYRSSATGACSAWSPPMRTGLIPRRQKVTLTPTVAGDAQVDKIDWVRFGGTLNKWLYLGTQPDSGTFDDELGDAELIGRQEFNLLEGWPPFVTLDNPFTATVNVVGVTVTGANFNTKWIAPYRGMIVIINNQQYTLFASPTSTSLLYLNENAGSQSSVTMYIPSPELQQQPLPILIGPYNSGGQTSSVIIGIGDTQNAGTFYWTNGDDPDRMRDTNFSIITSPSEQLITGGLLDGRAFIFSNLKMYWVYSTQDPNTGLLTLYAQESGCNEGIINRWALTTGNGQIFFVGKDGIYVTNGGQPQRITDSIYNIFPHDGVAGSTINGVVAPDYNNSATFMLEYGDGYIYFDYLGIDANKHTLVGDTKQSQGIAWSNDEYSPQVNVHYFEEGKGLHSLLLGGSDGRLYQYNGAGDGASSSTAISCQVRSYADNQDTPFNKKLYRDARIDYDPQGVIVTAQIGLDNYTTLPASVPLNATAAGRRQQELDLALYAKNITLDLTWSSFTASPKLYAWSPYYIIKPEDIDTGITNPDNLGTLGAKFVQGFRIQSNTYNVAKSFKVQADTGLNGIFTDIQTFSITSNGESTQAFSFTTPFICHEVRIIGNDANDWSILRYEFVWEPVPELVTQWIPQETTLDMQGFGFIRYFQVPHISTANLTLSVQTIDGVTNPIDTYTILHGGGNYTKSFQPIISRKGKAFKPSITSSAGFRLFQKDFECKYGQWNRGQSQLLTAMPIGDISRTSGARI